MGSSGHPQRPAATTFLGLLLTGLGMLLIAGACAAPLPQAWRLPVLALAAGLSAIGGPLKDITISTLRQMHIASQDMASAIRVQLLLSYLGGLVTMLATPLLCAWLGAVPVIAIGAMIYLAVGSIGWARPELRLSTA
jgi:hypothetical protein